MNRFSVLLLVVSSMNAFGMDTVDTPLNPAYWQRELADMFCPEHLEITTGFGTSFRFVLRNSRLIVYSMHKDVPVRTRRDTPQKAIHIEYDAWNKRVIDATRVHIAQNCEQAVVTFDGPADMLHDNEIIMHLAYAKEHHVFDREATQVCPNSSITFLNE